MSRGRRTVSLVIAGVGLLIAMRAEAQEGRCVSKQDCANQADARDDRVRREQFQQMAKATQAAEDQARQARAEARSRSEAGKRGRVQDVMRRRREAAAAGN